MVAGNPRAGGDSLRHLLKSRTRDLHDRLDALVGPAAVGSDAGYAEFLAVQHAARAPIERWALEQMPDELCPPDTALLLSRDLAELGLAPPADEAFAAPRDADPRGIAWALGGSSLGNKAMLVQRKRTGQEGADSFLSDTSTAAFFRRILPLLEQPVSANEADAAVAGAEAVFRTFLAAAARLSLRAAA